MTSKEQNRFQCQRSLPEIGRQGQSRIRNAAVLLVGMGGLGCPAAQYLAAAGVGTIGLVDGDQVAPSNLARQLLFSPADIDCSKVFSAKERLDSFFPDVTVRAYDTYLTTENIGAIADPYTVVIDATDDGEVRYLLDSYSRRNGKAYVYAALQGWKGQLAVFNVQQPCGSVASYAQLYPQPNGSCQTCVDAGVLGMLPGMLGTLQAMEAIKCVVGIESTSTSHLFLFDAKKFQPSMLQVPLCPAPCPYVLPQAAKPEWLVSPQKLKSMLSSEYPPQLIDVRGRDEPIEGHLGGWWIPLPELVMNPPSLPLDRPIIFYCRSGVRSRQAMESLQTVFPLADLRCLDQ